MPKFSVVLPVYNVAPFLRETLDSVLNQTFPDWECLCVDDGSKDGSGAILDEYAQKDKRFRVFHTENRGVAAARNLALDEATGDWIAFLDGDDAYSTDLFSGILPFTDVDEEVDIVRFDYLSVSEIPKENPPAKTKYSVYDLRKKIPRFATEPFCWDKIHRRQTLGDVRFKHSPIGQDALYSCETVCQARKVLKTEFCGHFYRVRHGSASHGETSYAKLRGIFGVRLATAKVWLNAGRRVPYSLRVSSLVKVSGRTSCHVDRFPPSPEKEAFMKEWIESLRGLLDCPMPPHYRLAFRAVVKHPRLHKLLFGFPFRFKQLIHVKRTLRAIKEKLSSRS